MDIEYTAAIIAAKASKIACRLLKRAGTSLPGKVALTLDPRILAKLSKGISVILVTGTNGKTTTTGMISDILDSAGQEHLVNKSGANLMEGIVTTFVEAADIKGRIPVKLALIEVDEATVGRLADSLQPDVLVVTNFFRDQLDRYGELFSVVEKVRSGISRFPEAKLVLNADDSLCSSLSVGFDGSTVFFGVEAGATPVPSENTVATTSYCLFCHQKYNFSYRVTGSLGGYQCPGCGFQRPPAQIKCIQVEKSGTMSSVVRLEAYGRAYTVKISAPGLFNVYNALAAAACCSALKLPAECAVSALEKFESCFGRMETIPTAGHKQIMLILAKNPAGFNQVINYLSVGKDVLSVSFVINDRDQDGTDVSWLWDVDFEGMQALKNGLATVFASGLRAEDMALRLKYAGIPMKKIQILREYHRLIDSGLASVPAGGTFFIVATYTAMMDIRKILRSRYGLKEIGQ